MPFVRRLIFKGENNWNGSTASRLLRLLWSIHPPSYCRPRGRRMTRNRFIIIIFPVYWFRNAGRRPISILSALLVLNSVNVPLEQSGFGRKHVTWPAIDRSCCIDQSLMQSYLNYSSDWPHWCTSFPTRTPALIPLSFPCLFLYGSLMYFASRLTQLFPKIWTSNLCLFLSMRGHICSSTLWSPDMAQIPGHMFSATTRSLMAPAFISAAQDRQAAHIFAPECTLCPAFPLPTPFHSAHVPMLPFPIHF